MRTVVITPPAQILAWADVNTHLRLGNDTSQQTIVMGMAAAAQSHIDGPAGWLGRAIGAQTLELRANSFACTEITLPYPEVISVASIDYLDADGADQTVDANDYEVAGRIVAPIWGKRWPATGNVREGVRIQYQAGFVSVPEAIKAALLIMVGDLYAGRESFGPGTVSALPSSATVAALLSPFRVYA